MASWRTTGRGRSGSEGASSLSDRGPLSAFVESMPRPHVVLGLCSACGGLHFLIFVAGNHPERGADANLFCVEPHCEDMSRPPR